MCGQKARAWPPNVSRLKTAVAMFELLGKIGFRLPSITSTTPVVQFEALPRHNERVAGTGGSYSQIQVHF